MSKEEVMKLAREAGGVDIVSNGWTSWVGTQSTEFLERFAALVAAAERRTFNFCPRCGKRTQDLHTCTPPAFMG